MSMLMFFSFSHFTFQELYLSGNRLTTLPPALCSLPRLQVLALRSNQLTTFPESLLTSASLTYLDLAYNRVEALPVEVLLRADPPALATLLLEGNPLQRPPIQCLQEEEESGSNELVTGFAQIDARLRRYYQVESGREGGENAGDEGKMTEEKEIKSKRVQQQTCDTSVTSVVAVAEDEGEDEDDDDVSYNVSRVFSFLLFSFMSSTNCSCLSLLLFLSPLLDRMKPTICLRDTPQRR